jgi:predicted transport protein
MSDIKLFRTSQDSTQELPGRSVAIERSLQNLIEANMDTFLGVTFLASEYSTGRAHGGRMDSLGIDENGCPVIVEYKRSSNENVINQGLFYLDWLMDHQADFRLLVLEKLGKVKAEKIEWSNPRLLCIAGDFNKYDEHAVKQMNRNIDLIRYRRYDDDLLMLELVNAVSATTSTQSGSNVVYKTVAQFLEQSDTDLQDLFELVKNFCLEMGDDVQQKELKNYFAFKRIKNFACVEVHPQKKKLLVFVKVNPDTINIQKGFTRDVRSIGHFGTGDLEITLKSPDDFEQAKQMLIQSYEAS